MAVIYDNQGNPLPMAQTDTPPNVGSMVLNGSPIAGAPAATSTNPLAAASQPPASPTGSGLPPTMVARNPRAVVSPDQAPVPASTARPPMQRGPASGVSTPVDQALTRATADTAVRNAPADSELGALSPTSMVLNYLTKQGLPRTSDNVRRALEANARDPSTISGLINQAPPAPTAVDTSPNSGGGRGVGSPKTSAPPAAPAAPAQPQTTPSGSPIDIPALASLSPQIARAILTQPGPPATGGGGGVGGGGGGGSPQPVVPRTPQGNPPQQTGETVALPRPGGGGGPPAVINAEPAGRVPPGPSGRVFDASPPSDMPPLRSAIDRALRPQEYAQPRVTTQDVTATAPRRLTGPATPTTEAPPISPENPVVLGPRAKALIGAGTKIGTGLTRGPVGGLIGLGLSLPEIATIIRGGGNAGTPATR